MSRRNSITFALTGIAIVALLVSVLAERIVTHLLETTNLSPGDVVINELSSAGADWVVLRNNTQRIVNLSGFIFTDGDNRFVLPNGACLGAGAAFRMASSNDQEKIGGQVDYYWGRWEIKKRGELVMLINNEGNMVVDFVFVPPMSEGQRLQRVPSGSGLLKGPNDRDVEQLRQPSYRAVLLTQMNSIAKWVAGLVVALGGFLGSVAVLLTNCGSNGVKP